MGRAIRKGPAPKISTIVIPVFIEPGEDGEEVLNKSAYQAIAGVLRALRAHDEFLGEALDTAARQLPTSVFAFIGIGESAGTLGRHTFRKDGIRNVNLSIQRRWRVGGDTTLQFRAESINFFNTAQFSKPGMSLSSKNFGQITNTLNDGRSFRFLLQFSF